MTEIQCAENGNDISCHPLHAVESLFFKLPWETRIGLKNRLVQERGGRISVGLSGGKQFLVLRIGSFGKTSNRKYYNSIFLSHWLILIFCSIPSTKSTFKKPQSNAALMDTEQS